MFVGNRCFKVYRHIWSFLCRKRYYALHCKCRACPTPYLKLHQMRQKERATDIFLTRNLNGNTCTCIEMYFEQIRVKKHETYQPMLYGCYCTVLQRRCYFSGIVLLEGSCTIADMKHAMAEIDH